MSSNIRPKEASPVTNSASKVSFSKPAGKLQGHDVDVDILRQKLDLSINRIMTNVLFAESDYQSKKMSPTDFEKTLAKQQQFLAKTYIIIKSEKGFSIEEKKAFIKDINNINNKIRELKTFQKIDAHTQGPLANQTASSSNTTTQIKTGPPPRPTKPLPPPGNKPPTPSSTKKTKPLPTPRTSSLPLNPQEKEFKKISYENWQMNIDLRSFENALIKASSTLGLEIYYTPEGLKAMSKKDSESNPNAVRISPVILHAIVTQIREKKSAASEPNPNDIKTAIKLQALLQKIPASIREQKMITKLHTLSVEGHSIKTIFSAKHETTDEATEKFANFNSIKKIFTANAFLVSNMMEYKKSYTNFENKTSNLKRIFECFSNINSISKSIKSKKIKLEENQINLLNKSTESSAALNKSIIELKKDYNDPLSFDNINSKVLGIGKEGQITIRSLQCQGMISLATKYILDKCKKEKKPPSDEIITNFNIFVDNLKTKDRQELSEDDIKFIKAYSDKLIKDPIDFSKVVDDLKPKDGHTISNADKEFIKLYHNKLKGNEEVSDDDYKKLNEIYQKLDKNAENSLKNIIDFVSDKDGMHLREIYQKLDDSSVKSLKQRLDRFEWGPKSIRMSDLISAADTIHRGIDPEPKLQDEKYNKALKNLPNAFNNFELIVAQEFTGLSPLIIEKELEELKKQSELK